MRMQLIMPDVTKIEAVLEEHPAIRQACILNHVSRDERSFFLAYLVGDLAVARIPIQSQCWCQDEEGNRVQLAIADISDNGICLLNTPRSWSLGKTIYLYLALPSMESPVRIPAKVVWHQRPQFSLGSFLESLGVTAQTNRQKDRTGLLFDETSGAIHVVRNTVKDISRNSGFSIQDLRRTEPRVPLHTNVRVRFADGRTFGWVTENISLKGIRIQAINGIWKKGQSLRLRLRLPGSSRKLDLSAIVWWHKGSQAGLRLHLNEDEESIIYQSMEYIVSTQGLSLEALERFLETNLPSDLIPRHFIMLEEMPLDAHGAIDKKALPRPDFLP